MALIDHFAPDAGDSGDPDENGFKRLPSHQFTDSLFLWATGDVTRAQVVAAWNLDATDQIQLDLLAATYTALPNDSAKSLWITKLEASLRLYEIGKITAAKLASILGL